MKGASMEELKPCPFCGKKAELLISKHENSDTTKWHKIMCVDPFGCGAEMWDSISEWQYDYKDAVQRLIDRWNRRITDGRNT